MAETARTGQGRLGLASAVACAPVGQKSALNSALDKPRDFRHRPLNHPAA